MLAMRVDRAVKFNLPSRATSCAKCLAISFALNAEERLHQTGRQAFEANWRVSYGETYTVLFGRCVGLMLKRLVDFLQIAAAIGSRGIGEGAGKDKSKFEPAVRVFRDRPAGRNAQ